MTQQLTLHKYLEMQRIKRKNQQDIKSQGKGLPHHGKERQSEAEFLIMQIIQYIQRVMGEGPLFVRFLLMMQQLQFTIKRQFTRHQDICVLRAMNQGQPHIDKIRQANGKLNEYLQKCVRQKQTVAEKLQRLTSLQQQRQQSMPKLQMNNLNIEKSPKGVKVVRVYDNGRIIGFEKEQPKPYTKPAEVVKANIKRELFDDFFRQ